MLEAEALGLLAGQLGGQGHDQVADRGPEAFDVGTVVVDPAHALVAELDEVGAPQLARHRGPDADQVVELGVQGLGVVGEPAPEDALGSVAELAVLVLAELQDGRDVVRLALEGELGRGQ